MTLHALHVFPSPAPNVARLDSRLFCPQRFYPPSSSRNRSIGSQIHADRRARPTFSCSATLPESGPTVAEGQRKISVLFVCLGNICRSPTAEAVFVHLAGKNGLSENFRVDSAGTINYHEGEPADGRMKRAASKRGINLTSISRPIRRSDFEEFDLILAMDRKNYADILSAFQVWNNKAPLPEGSQNKVKLMCSYCKKFDIDEVPDPYYGGPDGFEKVLDLLDDACGNLLESLVA